MYLGIIGAVIAGIMPVFTLLCFITVPFAIAASKGALNDYDDPAKFIPAQGANVMMNLFCQTFLAAGFLFAYLVEKVFIF